MADMLCALGENRDDEGVRPHAVLIAAETAKRIANALDSVNMPAESVSPSHAALHGIQGMLAEAVELIETTQRALEPNEQRASEYGVLA